MLVKIFSLAVKKLYFMRSFNNINGNHDPLVPQINFDQTYFGGFWYGGFVRGLHIRGVYIPEPVFDSYVICEIRLYALSMDMNCNVLLQKSSFLR